MKNKKILFSLSLIMNLILLSSLVYLTHRLGGIKFMLHRLNSGGLAGIYENRNNLFEYLEMEKGSIIFLGDSLTEFGQWEELMASSTVKNRGIAGDTSWGLLRRLKKITNQEPKMIFLMIGINDFLFTDRKEIFENYQKIIHRIKTESPRTQLFIQSVLPVNSNVKKTVFENNEINLLNQSLKALAQKERLIYLDIHSRLKDETGKLNEKYTADGVHINGAAYVIWKEIVTPHIHNINR